MSGTQILLPAPARRVAITLFASLLMLVPAAFLGAAVLVVFAAVLTGGLMDLASAAAAAKGLPLAFLAGAALVHRALWAGRTA
jgi:hypothetical protein